ncbi:MAG: CBS domain-containing protein [Leptospirales bacterium]|jgi:CBS domain-containing protein
MDEVYVRDIMTNSVLTVAPEDRVLDKLKVFENNGINHAPVVDDDKNVVGLVSRKDFENYVNIVKIMQAGEREPVLIRDIMTSPAFSFSENIHIAAAAQAMIDNQIHAIVIVDGKRLAGILTSTDLLKHMAGRERYDHL